MKSASGQKRQFASESVERPTDEWIVWAAGACAVALGATFFAYRGNDIGQIPAAVRSFSGAFQEFRAAELRDSVLGACFALAIAVAWFGYGGVVSSLLDLDNTPADKRESVAWWIGKRCAWGAGVSSLLMFAAGLAHLYTTTVSVLLLLVGLGLSASGMRQVRRRWAAREHTAEGPIWRIGVAIMLMPIVLCAIVSLAPPVAKDTLLYHIALPKAYIEAHGLVDVRYNIAQFYALGAELNGTLAMLLGRLVNARVAEAAFGCTEFAYLPILLLTIFGWMRERGCSKSEALLPVAMTALVPTLWSSASSGYNDCALALYATLAIAAAAQWWKSLDRRSALELGVAIGFGFGVKLLMVFVVVPLGLLLLFRLRTAQDSPSETSRVFRTALISVGSAVAFAAPWYVRNWIRTGSPVFPFYMNIFRGHAPGWDEQRSLIDQMLNARYGGYPKEILDYVAVPFRASLAAQPDIPKYFDGVLGIAFLVGVLLLGVVAVRKKLEVDVKIASGFAGAFALCWMFTSEQLRYLLPALPALAVGICAAIGCLDRRIRYVLIASVVPGTLVIGAWFLQQNSAAVVAGAERRDAYLGRSLDHYRMYETVNRELPIEARIWLINMRRDTYYLERQYFSDFRIEHFSLLELIKSSSSAEEMNQRARQMGVTHLLFRSDTLLDPATSPIIDDRLSSAENARTFEMARTFLMGERVVKGDGKFLLVQLR